MFIFTVAIMMTNCGQLNKEVHQHSKLRHLLNPLKFHDAEW